MTAARRRRRVRGSLAAYEKKRDFSRTPEPGAKRPRARRARGRRFVVQQHAARRMHFDFRLEHDGVLKSWAIPKGPSLDPGVRRMAVEVEDHPLDYAEFEGVIPRGEYGGGTVSVWDQGEWEPIGDPDAGLAGGKLEFRLAGEKLRGRWHLVRMRERAGDRGRRNWLLIKGNDEEAKTGERADITARKPASVLSGRRLARIAADADAVWSSRDPHPPKPKPKASRRERRASAAVAAEAAGLRRAPLPRTPAPELATLVDGPPAGEGWLHEVKLDGYRILAEIRDGRAKLWTRNGKDWTGSFPAIAKELAALPVEAALVDGEVVALDAEGRSRFQLLQNALSGGRAPLFYYAFDLLHLDGFDLRGAALRDRKQALAELLERAPRRERVRASEHFEGEAQAFFEEACRRGAEGVVSKRADSRYRSARTRDWLKSKCALRQEFVIVGYTDPQRSRVGFGALLLGVHDEKGALRYAGKVGTGFDTAGLASLGRQLEALERPEPAVVDAKRAQRGAHWVEPELVAEVSFTEWTDDDKIRHPSFVALRSDKPASEIRRERALHVARDPAPGAGAPPPLRNEVAGVRLSTPDRVYFPDLGVTKSELAQYYERMAERVLPGLAQRPLSMVRCPESALSECFYQKHATETVPARVPRVKVRPGAAPYAMVTDLPSLVSLVQIAVLEFHVWGARADQLDRPDLFVLDLDPDPSVEWPRLAEAALRLRALLDELGFVPFLRTTGGKGLHVVVPIVRRSSWEELKAFTHAIALSLVREAPDRYTAVISKAKRKGKILVDYLRNQREATAIASYSVRARAGAPVAVPIGWDELERAKRLPTWSVREAPERLALPDPWEAFERSRRAISAGARAAVGAD